MMKNSQKDGAWRAGLRLQVRVKSLVSSKLRREKSVEERSWVGAEAASHFVCLFIFSNAKLLKNYHSLKPPFIHSFVHIPELITGEC